MNEDNLNMEIRKFLKKVGISSQKILDNEITEAHEKGLINLGDNLNVEMTLSIESLSLNKTISGQIKIE